MKNISSTRKKLLISLTAFLAIAVLVIYNAIAFRYGKYGAISRLQAAVKNRDTKAASGLIKSSDKDLKIDEKNIGSFLDYLNSDPKNLKELMDNLHKQAASIEDKGQDYWNYFVVLKKSAGHFLSSGSYYFEMKPCYVNFIVKHASTKLYVDGNYQLTSDSEDFYEVVGPFVPGKHTVMTDCETVFGKAQSSGSANFIWPYSDDKAIRICPCYAPFSGFFATIDCNYNDAHVFINDKDIGKISDFPVIGPIDESIQNTMYTAKQFPWGLAKSDTIDISDLTSFTLYISGETKALDDELMPAVSEFNNSLAQALKVQNTSGLKNISPDFITAINSLIKDIKSQNKHFNGRYIKSDLIHDGFWVGMDTAGNYEANFECVDYYDTDFTSSSEVFLFKTSSKGYSVHYTFSYDKSSGKWTLLNANYTLF